MESVKQELNVERSDTGDWSGLRDHWRNSMGMGSNFLERIRRPVKSTES